MLLTMREHTRIKVIEQVLGGHCDVRQAATSLRRSVRTIYRYMVRYQTRQEAGLRHGNRGREPWNKMDVKSRERVVGLARGVYADINDQHLSELLAEREKLFVSRQTLRRWLRASGIGPKRKRRGRKFRQRRVRKEAFGMMLQIDASEHDWLQGRGPWLTLVAAKDDATGYTWARFVRAETTWAYFNLMKTIFGKEGLPISLYSDRHSIFFVHREPTVIEQLRNQRPNTQFGRAMNELGIECIPAYSAPAKGRIERVFGVYQDRLVVMLRLAGAKTEEEANRVLADFLPEYNRRFTVPARLSVSAFRKAPPKPKLDRILCLKETRTVNKDNTISFEGLILQIPQKERWRSFARERVEVFQLRDGSLEIVRKDECVARFSAEAVTRWAKTRHDQKPSNLKEAA